MVVVVCLGVLVVLGFLFLFCCFTKVSNKVCVKLDKGEMGVKIVLLATYSRLDIGFLR